MAWYLLEINDDGTCNGWWEIQNPKNNYNNGDELIVENRFGGHHTHIYSDLDEIVESDSFENLDWKKVLLNPDSPYGFIDPDGKFYGCDYSNHEDLARFVLKQSSPEEFGWVKIYHAGDEIDYYTRRKFLTEAQVKTLMERHIEVHDNDLPF